jgi:GNAT superfamily N-acetyltransferase
MSFVVLALPRSRTKWLSAFLSYREWVCEHDHIRHCRSLEDVAAWLSLPFSGSVETAAAPYWRLIPSDVRVATVRRPVEDVVASLTNLLPGVFDADQLRLGLCRLDRKLDQLERRRPDVLSVSYSELSSELSCARLFEHCLGRPLDPTWWEALAPINIQANLPHMLRQFGVMRPQLEKLAKLAAHRIIAQMRPPAGEFDGITFQTEPFRQFYAEGQRLIADHCVQTEQAPDDHARLNLPLLQALDDIGALQVLTARMNGRLFGYLLTIISPSLDSPDVVHGTHTAFYSEPTVRGLGMRLQRAAVAELRARGVHEVIMRAGVRGPGPRLGTYYRRLGADPFGELWKLSLSEAR